MSEKKTWLGKIIADILGTFKSNWPKFVASLWPRVPKELQEKVSLVVSIVENLKKFLDSPLSEVLVSVIPGELDDKLKDKLSDLLGNLLNKWDETAIEDKSDAIYLHGLGARLTEGLTDLSFGQSALTTEVAYQAFKKENK